VTWVARVGSGTIPVAEYQREYRDAEDRQRQMFGKNFSPELLKLMNLPEQVLNSLIDRRLLRAEPSAEPEGDGLRADGEGARVQGQSGRPSF